LFLSPTVQVGVNVRKPQQSLPTIFPDSSSDLPDAGVAAKFGVELSVA
jgi:hypothetical protein